ncbi:DUF4373 domain-containing protein [Oscillospiraceae bacterium LCP25S3_E10]|nr:DUF4373 domain-containing protein [Ruminococcus sp.]MDY2855868.1 DUF4373 domain-containing protein [Oscillospiraceae bacterium]
MARPIKKGLSYFPFDVDIFKDVKIRILMANYGANGVLLYIYLLTAIYNNGYYIKCNEDLLYVASADLGVSPQKAREIIQFCCKRSLFDDDLFRNRQALSSVGIQRRYQEMVKARAVKKTVKVQGKLWLLDCDETKNFIMVCSPEGEQDINCINSLINGSKSQINTTNKSKENKSKINESKEEESKAYEKTENPSGGEAVLTIPLKDNTNYTVTENMVKQLSLQYTAIDVVACLRKLADYMHNNHNKQRDRQGIDNYVRMWLQQDSAKAMEQQYKADSNNNQASDQEESYNLSMLSKFDLANMLT